MVDNRNKITPKILMIKTGSTLPSLSEKRGDFEDWIISDMNVLASTMQFVNAANGEALPECKNFDAIVVTGSHSMVTDHPDWSEITAEWLAGAVIKNIPVLGICYGHQLLAYSLGDKVGYNPKGPEMGTVEIRLTKHGIRDPLFEGMPEKFYVNASHSQSVLELSGEAKNLAYSNQDPCQAFVVGKTAWGVQFHPEFDAEITGSYIQNSWNKLVCSGKNPQTLMKSCRDTPVGSNLLRQFVNLVQKPQ